MSSSFLLHHSKGLYDVHTLLKSSSWFLKYWQILEFKTESTITTKTIDGVQWKYVFNLGKRKILSPYE